MFAKSSLQLKSVPGCCFRHFWMNSNEKTYNCQRSTIEIDTKGKIQDSFIDTSFIFIRRNQHERTQISYDDLFREMLAS